MQSLPSKEYKIAVLGPPGVGKSSLSMQFACDKFSEYPELNNYQTLTPYLKYITLDGEQTIIHILDTNNQGKLTTDLISQAQAFILVFDLTQSESFLEIDSYYQLILKTKNCLEVPIVIVGNKLDLYKYRQIDLETGKRLSMQWRCRYYEISAKTKTSVDMIFINCIRDIQKIISIRNGELSCCICCVL
ncbi:hypothetical protein SteCoe_22891 [Stentor coeruleus]|uniref:Uncharacterized protein n=1 Tax=Stentor coeruleus TaxID=5963 RepID=A0A1R2BL15_9CILI|nr:hypothetical protein SteCoe_22891 [Stentor coeruleus]